MPCLTIDCLHLGEQIATQYCGDTTKPIYRCGIKEIGQTNLDRCSTCTSRTPRQQQAKQPAPPVQPAKSRPKKEKKPKDQVRLAAVNCPATFVTREAKPLDLRDMYKGASLFLILSGPSLREMDLSPLQRRGILTMGVNNSPAVFRPNLWTHVDPPGKFHQSIWRDPHITKFMRTRSFADRLRVKEDGAFVITEHLCRDCPNVVGYNSNADFRPEKYLSEESVNWGNGEAAIKAGNPHHHVLNVMFAALKIPFVLGFRTVYLLGCDFRMSQDQPVYAFDEDKHNGAINSNNGTYAKLNSMLNLLAPKFDAAGYRVLNCTPQSNLLAFPRIALGDAINAATKSVPQSLDTIGWYASARSA